jgi:hypothetical protein
MMEYEEEEKKDVSEKKELYDWQIEFKGYIEIKGKHEKMPTCYPVLRYLQRAINEAKKSRTSSGYINTMRK